MSATDPTLPELRRFSIRLPRPLWIGLAAIVLVVVAVGLRVGVPIYRQQVALWEDCAEGWIDIRRHRWAQLASLQTRR